MAGAIFRQKKLHIIKDLWIVNSILTIASDNTFIGMPEIEETELGKGRRTKKRRNTTHKGPQKISTSV